jgi:hypothetical protein
MLHSLTTGRAAALVYRAAFYASTPLAVLVGLDRAWVHADQHADTVRKLDRDRLAATFRALRRGEVLLTALIE